ncbi:Arc family DNA-binding protein [Aureimonas sp. AU12]|uniref:Arc family DNA-binding protein n=1 Tax=Aureimonas sp. AU12 TaxID=1638161 RepID=UPI0009E7614A|nr:Arc family DNA-binding protein [Aureimonas sp. AU12]
MPPKAADFEQFQIRLPPGMREKLKRSAAENKRSMNAEIVKRLEETYEFVQTYFDFDKGVQSTHRPSGWYREQSYRAMDEDEITEAVIRYSEELNLAIAALRNIRDKNGK